MTYKTTKLKIRAQFIIFIDFWAIVYGGGHEHFRFRNFAKISQNFNFVFREIFC